MAVPAEMVVRQFVLELWGNRRVDLVDELVHPEYKADGAVAGRVFVLDNIARMHAGFPDLRIEITHLVADGDSVAVLFGLVGTHEGKFGGIEPTGRSIRFREAGFFRVEGGKVIEGDFVSDGLGARIQLGVLPETFWTDPHR